MTVTTLVSLLMICLSRTEAPSVKMKMEECGVQQLSDVTTQSSISDISCTMQCQMDDHCQLHFFNQTTKQCTTASVPDILAIPSTGCENNITVHVLAEYVASFESLKRLNEMSVHSCVIETMTNAKSHSIADFGDCSRKCQSEQHCDAFSFDSVASLCVTGRLAITGEVSICTTHCSSNERKSAYIPQNRLNNLKSCSETFIEKKVETCFIEGMNNLAEHSVTSLGKCVDNCKLDKCDMFSFNNMSTQCFTGNVQNTEDMSFCNITCSSETEQMAYIRQSNTSMIKNCTDSYHEKEMETCFIEGMTNLEQHTVSTIENCLDKCKLASCDVFSFDSGATQPKCKTWKLQDTEAMSFCPNQCTVKTTQKVYIQQPKWKQIKNCSDSFTEKQAFCIAQNMPDKQTQVGITMTECRQLCKTANCGIMKFSLGNCEIGNLPDYQHIGSCCVHGSSNSVDTVYIRRTEVANFIDCPKTCQEIKNWNSSYPSSLYNLTVGQTRMQVYCDMAEQQAWIVIQRRLDGTQPFDKTWEEYKNGFGDLKGEFWLGNEKLHQLTSAGSMKIRFDLWDKDDNYAYAEYSSFYMSGESDNYRLTIRTYLGSAGDSMTARHNQMMFSTKDNDNDIQTEGSCSQDRGNGGWWYAACFDANLNAKYVSPGTRQIDAQSWDSWKYEIALKTIIMKITYN